MAPSTVRPWGSAEAVFPVKHLGIGKGDSVFHVALFRHLMDMILRRLVVKQLSKSSANSHDS